MGYKKIQVVLSDENWKELSRIKIIEGISISKNINNIIEKHFEEKK